MRTRAALCLMVLAATATSVQVATATPLYEQRPDYLQGGALVAAVLSDLTPVDESGDPDALVRFDNFSLSRSATVTRVGWWGSWGTIGPGESRHFRLRFHESSPSGRPSAVVLYEASIDAALSDDESVLAGHRFVADLPSGLDLAQNTQYWISVVGDDPAYSAAFTGFGWFRGLGGDGVAERAPFDLAFVLVPEPSTAALVSYGLLGITLARKCMRRSRGPTGQPRGSCQTPPGPCPRDRPGID